MMSDVFERKQQSKIVNKKENYGIDITARKAISRNPAQSTGKRRRN
jgi:hypothetical protein